MDKNLHDPPKPTRYAGPHTSVGWLRNREHLEDYEYHLPDFWQWQKEQLTDGNKRQFFCAPEEDRPYVSVRRQTRETGVPCDFNRRNIPFTPVLEQGENWQRPSQKFGDNPNVLSDISNRQQSQISNVPRTRNPVAFDRSCWVLNQENLNPCAENDQNRVYPQFPQSGYSGYPHWSAMGQTYGYPTEDIVEHPEKYDFRSYGHGDGTKSHPEFQKGTQADIARISSKPIPKHCSIPQARRGSADSAQHPELGCQTGQGPICLDFQGLVYKVPQEKKEWAEDFDKGWKPGPAAKAPADRRRLSLDGGRERGHLFDTSAQYHPSYPKTDQDGFGMVLKMEWPAQQVHIDCHGPSERIGPHDHPTSMGPKSPSEPDLYQEDRSGQKQKTGQKVKVPTKTRPSPQRTSPRTFKDQGRCFRLVGSVDNLDRIGNAPMIPEQDTGTKPRPKGTRFHPRRHTLGGRTEKKTAEFNLPLKSYESPTVLRRSLDSPTQLRKDPNYENKREAFLDHLASRYPTHAEKIKGWSPVREIPPKQPSPAKQRSPPKPRRSPSKLPSSLPSSPKTKAPPSKLPRGRYTLHGASPTIPRSRTYDKNADYRDHSSDDIMSETDTSSTGFARGGKLRSSLPIVRTPSKSQEKPLGLVFLVFRDETKRALLPNEITCLDTVKALFVRSFPKQLTFEYLTSQSRKIYILDEKTELYYELENVSDVKDRSVLKVQEFDAFGRPIQHTPSGDTHRSLVMSSSLNGNVEPPSLQASQENMTKSQSPKSPQSNFQNGHPPKPRPNPQSSPYRQPSSLPQSPQRVPRSQTNRELPKDVTSHGKVMRRSKLWCHCGAMGRNVQWRRQCLKKCRQHQRTLKNDVGSERVKGNLN